MFGPLEIPPKLLKQALDDLHGVAVSLREIKPMLQRLPQVEDELSAEIANLRAEVVALRVWLEPLHREVSDLDETAENLERALAQVNESILGLHTLLKKLPGI